MLGSVGSSYHLPMGKPRGKTARPSSTRSSAEGKSGRKPGDQHRKPGGTNRKPSYKKRFGQHHLRHGGLCRPLLEYLCPEGRAVVEIGPGGGVLTAELLSDAARVIALEVDLEWAAHLRRALPSDRLSVWVADALSFSWERLPSPMLVTGNLPFNVGTPIIESVLAQVGTVDRAAFMVQKEVAERLVAQPGDPAYGALSVLVAAQAQVRYLGSLAARSFRPPPRVDAAYVGFELRQDASREDGDTLRTVVHQAFAQRRKTLRNSLSSGWGKDLTEPILAAANIDGRRRAETLSLEEFQRLRDVHRRLSAQIEGVSPGLS